MIILGLDTTGKTCSVALCEDKKILGEIFIDTGLTHSQTLMPAIDTLLSYTKRDVSDIDVCAVVNGPGSFTGVRIGLCTAMGLMHAHNKGIVCVDTFECLLQNAPYFDGVICPMIDARSERVYVCAYKHGEKILPDTVCHISQVFEALKGQRVLFLGDAVNTLGEKISREFDGAVIAHPNLRLVRASSACQLAPEKTPQKHAHAYYLNASSAEQNKKKGEN